MKDRILIDCSDVQNNSKVVNCINNKITGTIKLGEYDTTLIVRSYTGRIIAIQPDNFFCKSISDTVKFQDITPEIVNLYIVVYGIDISWLLDIKNKYYKEEHNGKT